MSDIAIRVESLSKQYRIGGKQERYKTLRDTLTDAIAAPFRRAGRLLRGQATGATELNETIWALKEISCEVKHGEVVGIIGRNGAGKSTLLKILSRITEPTEGYAEIHGRVGSLIEVGTGFHPELTGRENIYLNGAILGMKRAEINKKFDEIVAFAEMEKFIDTPVKHYSSGMYLRLAFAVAAHLEPEILLVDEVLAVGDVAFQSKCLGKMEDVAHQGRTVLFVSHNMAAIQNLCSSCQLLESGQLVQKGATAQVVAHYLQRSHAVLDSVRLAERVDRRGNGMMRFTEIRLCNKDGIAVNVGQTGEYLGIVLDYIMAKEASKPTVVRLGVANMHGQRLFVCLSRSSQDRALHLPRHGQIVCHIPQLALLPGRYYVNLWCKIDEQMADEIHEAFAFDVVDGDFFGTGRLNPNDGGDMLVKHRWEVR
jgi:lipopolysaccharide transport system ATP-binding protein